MAQGWIKWCKGLVSRREVIAIANRLSVDRRIVASCCMLVWEWADDNTTDGRIDGVKASDIDSVSGLPGMFDAMQQEGWIQLTENGIEFPNFTRHNGESAKKRTLASNRKSRSRHENVTKMSRSLRDKSVTRAEKSREEQNAVLSEQHSAGAAVLKKLLAAEKLAPPDLRDTSRLISLSDRLRAAPSAGLASEHDRLMLFAAAEHVLAEMSNRDRKSPLRNPIGLFAKLLSTKHWQDITDTQRDRAHERIKQYLRDQRPVGAALAQSFADKLAGGA